MADTVISRIAPLEVAGPGDLSFLSNPRYQQQLAASRAACVIVAPALRDVALARGPCIVADNPYVYFARATQLWRQHTAPAVQAGVHASAVVDPAAQVRIDRAQNQVVVQSDAPREQLARAIAEEGYAVAP